MNMHSVVWCTAYFDTSNHLGVDHQCDGQTDGQNYDSNSALINEKKKFNLINTTKVAMRTTRLSTRSASFLIL